MSGINIYYVYIHLCVAIGTILSLIVLLTDASTYPFEPDEYIPFESHTGGGNFPISNVDHRTADVVPGLIGNALHYVDDDLSHLGTTERSTCLEDHRKCNGGFTSAFWVKWNRIDVAQQTFGAGAFYGWSWGWGLVLEVPDFQAILRRRDGMVCLVRGGTPKLGWQHMAFVYNETALTCDLYIDGEMAGRSDSWRLDIADGHMSLYIGKRAGPINNGNLRGNSKDLILDEFLFWKTPKTSEFISEIYCHVKESMVPSDPPAAPYPQGSIVVGSLYRNHGQLYSSYSGGTGTEFQAVRKLQCVGLCNMENCKTLIFHSLNQTCFVFNTIYPRWVPESQGDWILMHRINPVCLP